MNQNKRKVQNNLTTALTINSEGDSHSLWYIKGCRSPAESAVKKCSTIFPIIMLVQSRTVRVIGRAKILTISATIIKRLGTSHVPSRIGAVITNFQLKLKLRISVANQKGSASAETRSWNTKTGGVIPLYLVKVKVRTVQRSAKNTWGVPAVNLVSLGIFRANSCITHIRDASQVLGLYQYTIKFR